MNTVRTIFVCFFGVACGFGPAAAGDAGIESPFAAGAGARALGLGGAFTSLANDASAVFYNPSGLSRLPHQEITGMHMTLFEGTIYDYLGWVYPTPTMGGFGIAYLRIGTQDIVRREEYRELGSFDYSYSQFLLSYGRQLKGGLSAGASLKIVNQSLDPYSDYGLGLDFGMMARLTRHVQAGLMARDIIPATLELRSQEDTVRIADIGETLPVTLAGGVALTSIALRRDMSLTAAFELEKTENRSAKLHAGAELLLKEAYGIRAGYDRDNFSFGVGLRYDRLHFDYAYKLMDYIADSHRFSVSYRIGASIPEQIRRRELEEERKGNELLEDERRRQYLFYKDKANQFYRQYQLDSALTYYQRALAFNETDEEVIKTIDAIKGAQEVLRARNRDMQESERENLSTIEAYYNQAQSFFAREYYPPALDMLGLILDIDPEHSEALALKTTVEQVVDNEIAAGLRAARRAQQEGDYIGAIEDYTRLLYLEPDNEQVRREKQEVVEKIDLSRYLNLGIDLFRAGHYAEAREKFMLVLSAKPNESVAKDYVDRIDVALAHPPTLTTIQSDRRVWQQYLNGLRHMRSKEYQLAIESWEKVLEAYPNNKSTLDNLEQARLRLKLERGE